MPVITQFSKILKADYMVWVTLAEWEESCGITQELLLLFSAVILEEALGEHTESFNKLSTRLL